jgi:chromosome segregation ATPase
MTEEVFEKRLAELVAEIGALPLTDRTKLQALAEETRQRHEQIKDTIAKAQDSIDTLRLSLKYLLFDLEASRRENLQLRKKIEDGSKEGE